MRCFTADWMDFMEKQANLPKENSNLEQWKQTIGGYGSVMVLVTDQYRCERLIHAGRVVADISAGELTVLNIQNNAYPQNPQALQHLFNVSSQNGAAMQLLYSDNAYRAICQYIKDSKVAFVVTGLPHGPTSIFYEIWDKVRHVQFFTVNEEGKLEEVIHRKTHGLPAAAVQA